MMSPLIRDLLIGVSPSAAAVVVFLLHVRRLRRARELEIVAGKMLEEFDRMDEEEEMARFRRKCRRRERSK